MSDQQKPRIRLVGSPRLREIFAQQGALVGMHDGLQIMGHLEIFKRDSDGPEANIIEVIDCGSNLVVDTGRTAIMRATVGFDHPNNLISAFEIGDGASGPPSNPDPPVAGDTALGNTIRSLSFASTSFPATGQILLTATIATGVGVGEAYNEAGLVTLGSPVVLIARKTFAEINQVWTLSLEFRWTLTLTAS